MKTNIRYSAKLGLTILAGLAITVLGAAPAGAGQVTKIDSCPFTITTPGKYVVTSDLSCGGDYGILVAADGVDLNGNGKTIYGAADGVGLWVLGGVEPTDSHVQNLNVIGWGVG